MNKQTLRRKQSKIDGQLYWVATNPFGYPMWQGFTYWLDAAQWLMSVPFYRNTL